MAEPEESEPGAPQARHATANGEGRGRTKVLGVLVAIMVVAGVVALVMTVFGGNSNKSQADDQPSASQVGRASSTAASTSAPSTSAAPTTAAPSASVAPTTSAPSASAPATTAPAVAQKAKSSGSAKSSTKIVKYRVKRGDNLTQIAKWFNQRGYGLVYNWNKSVIGRNPNLIYPGQTIIVSLTGDRMKVSTKNK